MGKKQHSKDRLFITRTEWNNEWGGYKEKKVHKRQLPYYCCALSLQPFTHPYGTKDGYVFDLTAILPYVKKHKSHPITGEKLSVKELVKLTFHKNDDGEYHCPITRKVFNKSSYIVAVGKTGNVYSYEAVKELNVKKGEFRDLIDSTPFAPTDIITIQNPQDAARQNVENFVHIARSKGISKEDLAENEQYQIDPVSTTKRKDNASESSHRRMNPEIVTQHAQIRHNSATKRIFAEIQAEHEKEDEVKRKKKRKVMWSNGDKLIKNKVNELGLYNKYTTGRMAASFTSTAMTPVFTDELQPYTEQQIREEKWRNVKGHGKKGYVRMTTNMGDLNLLLDCDYAPKTCYNFLVHCENGYYDRTVFHRNIMSFMIQGGDPKGTGHGGECAWKTKNGKFEDEFHKLLKHDERGVVAMANSGPDSNGSQFYILYQAAPQLDDKHSVFGRLVGGMEVLNRMEEVPVEEETDRPLKRIEIIRTKVFANPFNDPLPHQIKAEEEEKKKQIARLEKDRGSWWSDRNAAKGQLLNSKGDHNDKCSIDGDADSHFGVGKYIADRNLLQHRYGIGGKLRDSQQKYKGKRKEKRAAVSLPNPKTSNDLVDGRKHIKLKTSVFRFKSFDVPPS